MKLPAGEAEQQRQSLDLVRLRHAPERHRRGEFLRHLGLAMEPAARDVGEERTGRDRIDPHVVGGEIDGGVADDVDNGGLGRGIAVADQRLRAQAGDRGGGDDAAAALPFHVGGGEADGHEGRGQVQLDRTLKQREVHGVDGAVRRHLEARAGGDAGIGEHRVEAAVALRRCVDRGLQRRAVADVDDGLLDRAARGGEARCWRARARPHPRRRARPARRSPPSPRHRRDRGRSPRR